MEDPVQKAIAVLNDALERDPRAVTQLVNLKVDCNRDLVAHPTIQSTVYEGTAKLGVLGLINGLIGDSPTGVIGAEGTIDTNNGKFLKLRRFIDLRDEKTDVIA